MFNVLRRWIFGQAAPEVSTTTAAASVANRSGTFISSRAGDLPVALIPATGRGYFMEVHGESHYQDVLTAKWQTQRPDREWTVRLTAEPTNPHDPFAVAVQTFDSETIGYLPRPEARKYQQLLLQLSTQGLVGICSAKFVGGTDTKPTIGIYLDIEPVTVVAKQLGLKYHRAASTV